MAGTAQGADAYDHPATGGDNDEDDAEGMKLWGLEGAQGNWNPPCWHKSPMQMQEECRSMNMAAFASAASAATKHSNPPQSTSLRPF